MRPASIRKAFGLFIHASGSPVRQASAVIRFLHDTPFHLSLIESLCETRARSLRVEKAIMRLGWECYVVLYAPPFLILYPATRDRGFRCVSH